MAIGEAKSEVDLAEGHRYLAQLVQQGFELIFEAGNPEDPELLASLNQDIR